MSKFNRPNGNAQGKKNDLIPCIPYHFLHYSRNHSNCFLSGNDYEYYLQSLHGFVQAHGVQLHAYVLMPNHVQWLFTIFDREVFPVLIRELVKSYSLYRARTYGCKNTVWRQTHQCSPVQGDKHILNSYRYIEQTPAKSGLITHPGNYSWSSYRTHAYGMENKLITRHESYRMLGSCETERRLSYRRLLAHRMNSDQLFDIQCALQESKPLGDREFIQEIDRITRRNHPGRIHSAAKLS